MIDADPRSTSRAGNVGCLVIALVILLLLLLTLALVWRSAWWRETGPVVPRGTERFAPGRPVAYAVALPRFRS
jgi:hypothetical protein